MGSFTDTERGLFAGCTGNTGNPVIGGTYTWVLHSANGPRTCPAASTTATYTTATGIGHWWTNVPSTGQEQTYISKSTHLVSITATGLNPPLITVVFLITSGAFVEKTITGTGYVTEPNNANFLTDCSIGSLAGDGLTGGTLTVP